MIFGVLAVIARIRKPREPIEASTAVLVVVLNAPIVVLLVLAGLRL
jgi:hypothetical protein